mgnify:CR=1 FL=1
MKKFRIIYPFGSIRTDVTIKAVNIDHALSEFYRMKGFRRIVSIEECE